MRKKIFLASPFFNPTQRDLKYKVKIALERFFIVYECEDFAPGLNPVNFYKDLDYIGYCDALLAITDSRDPGTFVEVGYAIALKKPIVYLWNDRPQGAKFNLMLAQSAIRVLQEPDEIDEHTFDIPKRIEYYSGELE